MLDLSPIEHFQCRRICRPGIWNGVAFEPSDLLAILSFLLRILVAFRWILRRQS